MRDANRFCRYQMRYNDEVYNDEVNTAKHDYLSMVYCLQRLVRHISSRARLSSHWYQKTAYPLSTRQTNTNPKAKMKLSIIAILAATIIACGSPTSNSEPVAKQESALSTITQFAVSYTSSGKYYIGFNQSTYLCMPSGYAGAYDFEFSSLDADANNNYFVDATVNLGTPYIRYFGVSCVPWSSVADTGGQAVVAWHGNTLGRAYDSHRQDVTNLPTSYPAGHQLCMMRGMGGVTQTNNDLSEVLWRSNQIYTSTSFHSDQVRLTWGTCDEFTNQINLGTYSVQYFSNASRTFTPTPANQICGVTYVTGDMTLHGSPVGASGGYWWSSDASNRGLSVYSRDGGATWPWAIVRCLALY